MKSSQYFVQIRLDKSIIYLSNKETLYLYVRMSKHEIDLGKIS